MRGMQHVLEVAIRSDTQFLAQNDVMDYSLLVGLDAEKKVCYPALARIVSRVN